MAKIKIDNLANEIVKNLAEYTTEVEESVEVEKANAATELVKDLKSSSPVRTGRYKKGWAKKREGTGWVVHNRTDYYKTHLLEHGHAKRGGGRVQGKPHIAPAEERMVQSYLNKIEKAIKS
jgi:hypothetical protein